jgi:hypothetical protein
MCDAADDVSSEGQEHEADGPANRPELGHLAQWTVSSHKYGFGVDNLRDGNENTFWQYVVSCFQWAAALMVVKVRRSSTPCD